MKPIYLAIAIGVGLVAPLEDARAQNEEKPVPQAPYLAPVPDYGHWIVTFKYDAPPPANPAGGAPGAPAPAPAPAVPATTGTATPPASSVPDGSPTSIETIKTGDLRGITLSYTGRAPEQITCQGNWILRSTPNGAKFGLATPTSHPYIYYTLGYIMMDGVKIGPSTFREAAKHKGVMAFHYRSGNTDVWISPDTMLPLAVKQEGVEGTYQFLTPPPRPFPIPKDQEALLEKEQSAYKTTNSMR